jgi:hypothetical protein
VEHTGRQKIRDDHDAVATELRELVIEADRSPEHRQLGSPQREASVCQQHARDVKPRAIEGGIPDPSRIQLLGEPEDLAKWPAHVLQLTPTAMFAYSLRGKS